MKEQYRMLKVLLNSWNVASFDVDAQLTFTPECPDELPVAGGTEIVSELNAQAALASVRVFSKDAHNEKAIWVATEENPQFSPIAGNNVDIRWKRHGEIGTKGFGLIPGLPREDEYDIRVYKGIELDEHPYGNCYYDMEERCSTGVIESLHGREVLVVIVGGLATDYCVKLTVLQLIRAGFIVIVNLGACRGIAPESTLAAIKEMEAAGALIFNNAAEIKEALEV